MKWLRASLAIAQKEFRHMSHDRTTLMSALALPVFQLLLFGYALEVHVRNVPTAVLNLDQRQASRTLVERLSESSLFSVATVATADQIQNGLRSGAIRVGIEIPADYSDLAFAGKTPTLRLWIDGSNPTTAEFLLASTDALRLRQSLEQTVEQRVAPASLGEIAIQPHTVFNPDRRMAAFLIPGLIAILVQSVTTLLVALSLVKERENGTLDQMLATPIGPSSILAGKLAAYACLGFAEGCAILLLMRFLFGVAIQGSTLLLAAGLLLILLPSLGIGLLISVRAKHQAQAMQLMYLIFLPSVLLSGYLYPIEFMPRAVQWISRILPTTYLVDVMRGVILKGQHAGELLVDVASILLLAAIIHSLALWMFQRRVRA